LVSFGYLEALRATRGEYYALASFSAAGMCLLGQATDLIVIFISLEVMSLAVYCLSAYLRHGQRPAAAPFQYFVLRSFAPSLLLSCGVVPCVPYCLRPVLRRGRRPAGASFSYFVLGSFPSAFFLYGAALPSGATGSTRLSDVANAARPAAGGGSAPAIAAL